MFSLTLFYLVSGVDLVSKLQEVLKRKRELEKRCGEILSELSKLKPEKGSLEYKPVRNKLGYTYHYWYLRKWENGKLRSIYLGAKVPESLFQRIQDRNRARKLQSELREVEGELCRITNALAKVEDILSSL